MAQLGVGELSEENRGGQIVLLKFLNKEDAC